MMVTQDDILIKVKGMLSAVGLSGMLNPLVMMTELIVHLDQLLKMVVEYEGMQLEEVSECIVKWLIDDRLYQIKRQAEEGKLDRSQLRSMIDSIKEQLPMARSDMFEDVYHFVEEAEEVLDHDTDAFEDFINGMNL